MLRAVVPGLLLSAVAEAVAITILFPQHLPHNSLVWALLGTLALNFSVFFAYSVFIYPFFISPLRHLPGPKVGWIYTAVLDKMTNDGLGRLSFYKPRFNPFQETTRRGFPKMDEGSAK